MMNLVSQVIQLLQKTLNGKNMQIKKTFKLRKKMIFLKKKMIFLKKMMMKLRDLIIELDNLKKHLKPRMLQNQNLKDRILMLVERL